MKLLLYPVQLFYLLAAMSFINDTYLGSEAIGQSLAGNS